MKKAFTLVELMGVIVILGVMSSIVTVTVNKNIQKGNITTCLAQEKTIIEAAKTRQVDKPNDNSKKITISTLKSEGYLDDTLENPMTGKPYNDNTYVSNSKGTYELVYVGEKDCTNTMGKTEEEILASLPVIKSWTSSASTDFHDKKYKENITSIEFIDLNDDNVTLPADAPNNTTSWDVSEKGNQSVIAWVTADPQDNDKYVLHIAAKDGVFANKNSASFFSGFKNLKSVAFNDNFDTSYVTDMSYMFDNCEKLTNIDLSNFNTENTTKMHNMFYNCKSLQNLNLKSFNTKNVTDMGAMFQYCESLTELDLSNFNTSKVTTMIVMFDSCKNLKKLNIKNFDTSNVETMLAMFSNCSSIESIDVSSFNTSKVTNMLRMFHSCDSLKSIDVSGFNTSNVTDMQEMFCNCESLKNLDLSNFNTSNVTTMYQMFMGAESLENLNIKSFNTSKVTTMRSMFAGCKNLTELDLSSFDTSKVTVMGGDPEKLEVNPHSLNDGMFENNTKLKKIYVSNLFNTSNVTKSYDMFYNCPLLEGGNGTAVATKKVYDKTYAKIDKPGQEGYFTQKTN